MKEYEIKEKRFIFKTLKRIEIDLLLIGFSYIDDNEKSEKIRNARKEVIDIIEEVDKELREHQKK